MTNNAVSMPFSAWFYAEHPLVGAGFDESERLDYAALVLSSISEEMQQAPGVRAALSSLLRCLQLDPSAEVVVSGYRYSQLVDKNMAWVALLDMALLQSLAVDDEKSQIQRLQFHAQRLGVNSPRLWSLRPFVLALCREERDWVDVFDKMSMIFFASEAMYPHIAVFAHAAGAVPANLRLESNAECQGRSMPIEWSRDIGMEISPQEGIVNAGSHMTDRTLSGFFSSIFEKPMEDYCFGGVTATRHGILAEKRIQDGQRAKPGEVVGMMYVQPG